MAAGITNQAAGIVLLVIGTAAFNNYQRGTLKPWMAAKFANKASTAGPGQQLVGSNLRTASSAGTSAASGALVGIANVFGGGGGDIVTVRGIKVDRSISVNVSNMVDAAAADGVTLAGGGYRSTEAQKALRAAHGCGGARIMDPKCKCSPPTAVPGTSMHEKGLAIDFNNCGRGSKAFNWLTAHAASYGFKNLPSESWHWSVNGR